VAVNIYELAIATERAIPRVFIPRGINSRHNNNGASRKHVNTRFAFFPQSFTAAPFIGDRAPRAIRELSETRNVIPDV
jgi:hypothetical protein